MRGDFVNRKTSIVFRRVNRARKPAAQVTDRAKRYRAHQKENRPDPPKQCNFCGRRRNVDIHHANGNESDGEKQNLMWACRRCNVSVGNLMRKHRIGRLTRQYNPAGKHTRAIEFAKFEAGNATPGLVGGYPD